MKNYKLLLQYDGTRYRGWQKQGNTAQTVQGKIEEILSKLLLEEIEVHGSGRTDAGVHALSQCANFHTASTLSEEEILAGLTEHLPKDIAVLSLTEAPERFHARLHAVKKTYCYRIVTEPRCDVFERKYCYCYGRPLVLSRMEEAAELLLGTHDFFGFSSGKRTKKSTVRTLFQIEIKPCRIGISEGLCLRFTGDGFLYNMVRILCGTLIEVGAGKRTPQSVVPVFRENDRTIAGFTAPAEGLFLESVEYEK